MSLISEVHAMQERIASRMRELEPLVREYEELRELAAAMGMSSDVGAAATPGAGPVAPVEPVTPKRRRQARSRPAGTRGRKAPAGPALPAAPAAGSEAENELAGRILAAVRAEPGKTVAEYAVILDSVPTTLYRPVRRLTTEGALVKRARQLFPA